jgi:protein-tyrosine phosphatase
MDREGRRAQFLDKEWRARIVQKDIYSTPLPLKLEWRPSTLNLQSPTTYEVKVELDGKTVFATNTTDTTANVWNLEIAREYVWTVCGGGECARGRFRTRDQAPRVVYVPNVGNIRDLGGRIGLGGRRVKQGLAFRSAGLNSNASTYYSCSETLKMYKDGVLEQKFGKEGRKMKERIDRDKSALTFDPKAPYLRKMLKKDEKDWKPGHNNMTAEGLRIANVEFGWKSDIDLRSDIECWGMKGSPAGENVKWWHYSSLSYAGMATEKGKEAFKKVFRVFLDERNYPLDFHCIGGADRTGAVAFILNALLGVSDEELDKDWEFTVFIYNDQNFGHKTRFDKLRKVFDAYPGANTREKVEAYVKELGFTDADIEKFRSIMLEK